MEEQTCNLSAIKDNLKKIAAALPTGVTLVAVSKTHPAEAVLEAYNAGQRVFGENKVQEMTAKHAVLPSDIEWHFIGHVQRNKIRQMAPYVTMIHGIDSYDALAETSRQAAKNGRTIKCLLQLHVAAEETKFGFTPRECLEMLRTMPWRDLEGIEIAGVMGMATNTDDTARVHSDFRSIRECFDNMKREFFSSDDRFRVISAGMSGDYTLAIEEGSNMVRIGSSIFGERHYGTASH